MGSEQFTWKTWGTPPELRVCSVCGKALRVSDVGLHRMLVEYRDGTGRLIGPEFFCVEHRRAA